MPYNWKKLTLSDVIIESTERSAAAGIIGPVYGVDRQLGLSPQSRYTSENLDRYKVVRPGMFAYNPMRLNIGSIGYCQMSGNSGLVSPDYVVFQCREGLWPDYFNYFIKHPKWDDWVRHAGTGSVRTRIYFRELARMPINLPSLTEQKAIAETLGSIDEKIDITRKINITLEAIAQSIFKSWFIDFNPVIAKIENKNLEELDLETANLFPNQLVESPIGKIPIGWEVRSFLEAVKVIGGGTPKTSNPEYWGGNIPWFSVVDAPDDGNVFTIDTEKKITDLGLANSSTKLLPIGATIISARGTIGKIALVGKSMAMNQSCYGLKSLRNDVFFTYFTTRQLVSELKQNSHGSVFDTITRDTLASVSCIYPPHDILQKFESHVEPLFSNIRYNIDQIYTLENLRKNLILNLLSGKLLIPSKKSDQ